MLNCARPGCPASAKSECSACAREHYCGSSCQKADWKVHKSMCPTLKKLSEKLQPYREVIQIIEEIQASEKGKDIRILEHLLSYADFQFGKRNIGKDYRERENGERLSNWTVEIAHLYGIVRRMCKHYTQDISMSHMGTTYLLAPHLDRSLLLLNPWMIHLDSLKNGISSFDKERKDYLLQGLYYTEQSLAVGANNGREFDKAEGHCKRCLAYSRRFGVDGGGKTTIGGRTTMIFHSLKTYCALREKQEDYSGAVEFAEEAYNLVVEVYDPVHPQVQEAAGILINVLIGKGDLFNSERFASVTYSNLRDKKNGMDQNGEEVAKGAHNLADVMLLTKGDLPKAEELVRESLRIRLLRFGKDHDIVGMSYDLLSNILQAQHKIGDELKEIMIRYIAISIRNEGPDCIKTALGNQKLGGLYFLYGLTSSAIDVKRTHLVLAKSHINESKRIFSKIYGVNHPKTFPANMTLAGISQEMSE